VTVFNAADLGTVPPLPDQAGLPLAPPLFDPAREHLCDDCTAIGLTSAARSDAPLYLLMDLSARRFDQQLQRDSARE